MLITPRHLPDLARPLPRIQAAIVHPCDEVSLTACLAATQGGFIHPVLVGPRGKIKRVAEQAGLDLQGCDIEDVPHSHAAAARALAMAVAGEVEALVKGSLHTDELMQAAVQSTGGLRTKRRMTHCFLLSTAGYPRPYIVSDAAINISPDLDAKADIIRNAIDLAHLLGVPEPRVAILSAIETVTMALQSTLDAAALCKMADRGQIVGALLDGPLAFDNAISASAATIKGIVSDVAGRPDVLIVPDLESGNLLVKQAAYLGDTASAGIVMGAKVPIVLTSRADTLDSRLASCALAVMLAHHYRAVPP